MIRPWIFELFPNPGRPDSFLSPAAVCEYFHALLGLWANAEEMGFEGIFFSEHHFGPGFSPSPNLLIANLAARTRTLRLGVMGVVVPFYEPWRVFEEIAMLDHLTAGRLEIGTATGVPQETARIGLSFEEATARYLEALEILDAALERPVISHHGRFWNFDNLRLVPRPLQQPWPPKWTTVVSEESARRSARRGSKICTGFHPVSRVASIFDAYRDEAERLGKPTGGDQLALRRAVTIDPNHKLALEKAQIRKKAQRAVLASDPRVPAAEKNGGGLRPIVDAPVGSHTFSLSDEEFIAGNPESVTEQIIEQCERVGAGNFLAIFDRYEDPAALRAAFELFGREVIPAMRARRLAP